MYPLELLLFMDHLRARPKHRSRLPRRLRRLISTVWISAAVALPVVSMVLISSDALVAPVSGQVVHQVVNGENLATIARRYDVSVDELVQANGLSNPDQVYVGQELSIPGAAVQIHTVQIGESLALIAERYGVSTESILVANGLSGLNDISAGQQLTIPGAETTEDSTGEVTYVVKRGDSLYRISLVFGVSVDTLLATNRLSGANAIYPGLVLRIPAPDQVEEENYEQVTHTVRAGQTLSEIAIMYDTSVDRIVAANDLVNPARLSIGQVLNIPAPGATARPEGVVTATVHRVQAGETLTEIAIRYGVATHTLAVANGLTTTAELVPGQELSIPDAQIGINSVAYASVGEGLCEDVELQGTGTGYFARPVTEYALTQGFYSTHTAVDLAYELGTPVSAADGGTVVFSGWNPTGYGNLVILDHGNGWRTYYAHLDAIFSGCGDWVGRGDILGELGNTGNSSGPHLHFEMLRFGTAVNPVGYIRF